MLVCVYGSGLFIVGYRPNMSSTAKGPMGSCQYFDFLFITIAFFLIPKSLGGAEPFRGVLANFLVLQIAHQEGLLTVEFELKHCKIL